MIFCLNQIQTVTVFFGGVGGFPGGSDGKESACNAGDLDSILRSGRSPGVGNGNPLQYSCLENSTGRGAWQATVHGVAKELDTTEQLTLTNLLTATWSFKLSHFFLCLLVVILLQGRAVLLPKLLHFSLPSFLLSLPSSFLPAYGLLDYFSTNGL